LLIAAVVFTVTVEVPLCVPEVSVTVWPPRQVGRSVAPAGLEVTAHVNVTVPAYPVLELTVMVEVPGAPGATVNAVAARE
jgi:hypothetical protein